MAKLKFDKEATLERFFKSPQPPSKDSLLGTIDSVYEERDQLRAALEHIANTSNNYESKYAQKILNDLNG